MSIDNQYISIKIIIAVFGLFALQTCISSPKNVRKVESFNKDWKFFLGDVENGFENNLADSSWRKLNLPHDWSIEGSFSEKHPATPGGGALPGGIGWYRKSFSLPENQKDKLVFIEFDGIYKDSEVWINGHYLGKRPNGYISFRYELTNYLNYGGKKNLIAVKVDNSKQPNSRWYSGSGIYRNVRLVTTNRIYVNQWGTYITTPQVNQKSATLVINTKVNNDSQKDEILILQTSVEDENNKKIGIVESEVTVLRSELNNLSQKILVENPLFWSVEKPNIYKAITLLKNKDKVFDRYETKFGIRTFGFKCRKGIYT